MKRWLWKALLGVILAVCGTPLLSAQVDIFRGGFCMNPLGAWIPIKSPGLTTPLGYQPAPFVGLFGSNNGGATGSWYPLQCDSSGNLSAGAILGTTIPSLAIGCLGSSDGSTLSWLTCSGGGGSVSGQANGKIPLATSATAIGAQSHMDDGVTTAGTITSTEPVTVTGSSHGVTIAAGTQAGGAAGSVVYGSDSGTSGYAEANENNTGYARLCTATNGVCSSATWPPSAAAPTFSPAAGAVTSGTTVTVTSCPSGSTAYISAGTTVVAGGTGISVSSPQTLYGSCQGGGYFTVGTAAYTISGSGKTFTLVHHVNSTTGAPASSRTVTLGWTAAVGDLILVFQDCAGTSSTPNVITDNASGGTNTWTADASSNAAGNAGGWNVTIEGQYILSIPKTFTTITTTCAASANTSTVQVFEFSVSGGTPALDTQAVVNSMGETAGTETGAAVTATGATGACGAYMMGGTITANPKASNAFNVGNDTDGVYGDFGGLALIYSGASTYTPQLSVSGQVLGAASTVCFK